MEVGDAAQRLLTAMLGLHSVAAAASQRPNHNALMRESVASLSTGALQASRGGLVPLHLSQCVGHSPASTAGHLTTRPVVPV